MEKAFSAQKERLRGFKAWRNLIGPMKKVDVPGGIYQKCPKCGTMISSKELEEELYTCSSCGYHLTLRAKKRIEFLFDPGSFKEFYRSVQTADPLTFPGYEEKISELRKKTKLMESVVCGVGTIDGIRCAAGIMDNRFLMGSMGAATGEKITRIVEFATRKKLPLILVCTSGGARMQEGIYSLLQMAKTSAAIAQHQARGLLYLSVLTHPTTGGVTASFAMLGDIILAEPEALIGFAGPRVIEQTMKQKLPDGFQSAEFQQERGFVDKIVPRKEMRETISALLKLHVGGKR